MDDVSKEIWKQLLPEQDSLKRKAAKPKPRPEDSRDPDHWSLAILLERAAYLRQLARHGDGQASETLQQYPQHATMLSFRARDGEAEQHARFADMFYVLEGRATLVTGGTVMGARTIGPGEIRGDSILDGRRQELRAGDLAHVPAGVPHQILMAGDKTITSFVLKIEQDGKAGQP